MPTPRILLVIIITITLIFSIVNGQSSTVFSQNSLEKSQEDYSFQYTKYRDAHEKYLNAKAAYESFKTVTSKNDAFLKTKDYLNQIDNVYIAYILLVKEYGNNVDWSKAKDQRTEIAQILDLEISAIGDHQKEVSQAKTLEELPNLASSLKKHILEVTQLKINKAQATYEVVDTEAILNDFENLSSQISAKIEVKYATDNSVFSNWISEVETIRAQSKVYIEKAKQTFARTPLQTAQEGEIKQISLETNQAKSQLKKSRLLFEEILRIL